MRIKFFPCAGVEHVAGDMFQSVPKGDAIFMKVNCNLQLSRIRMYKCTQMNKYKN